MIKGNKVSAVLSRSWKKFFSNGIVIPTKMRRCNECNDEILCDECNNQVNENIELGANLNDLKRKPPNQFGHMLPYYKF